MKTFFVRNAALVLVVSVFASSFMNLAATNFSGTWALNESKSELGQFGARGVASKIVVDQKDNNVTLTRTAASFNGDVTTTTETLTADGKESETTVFGTAKKKSTLKWAADGSTFTITYSVAIDRGGQSMEFKGSETWGLGADGKTVTLQTSISTPNGDISTKAVYDKQ